MEKLLKALIKSLPEAEFDTVCDLWTKLLQVERELLPLPEQHEHCISPEWHEIGEPFVYSGKYSLECTRDFLRHCKEKRNSKPLPRKKKGSKSILEILERYGVRIKAKMILCPFHNERTPSCRIYPETNTFYCFGCGKHGTAEDLEKALRGEV